MMSPVRVSRLPVGSSARIRAGSLMSARAMATRLDLASRELIRQVSPVRLFESRLAQRRFRPFLPFRPGHARVHEGKDHVPDNGGPGQQVERLEDEAYPRAPHVGELVVGEFGYVLALEEVPAARRRVECSKDMHESRFARSRRPHDRDVLAGVDGEADTQECRGLRVAGNIYLGQVAAIDHVAVRRCRRRQGSCRVRPSLTWRTDRRCPAPGTLHDEAAALQYASLTTVRGGRRCPAGRG